MLNEESITNYYLVKVGLVKVDSREVVAEGQMWKGQKVWWEMCQWHEGRIQEGQSYKWGLD